MILLYAAKNRLSVRKTEPLTSGSVNVYEAGFAFSPDWDGLDKTAVFRAGEVTKEILLTDGCMVPWEVLGKPGVHLQAGVRGTRGGEVVLPTVWADLGVVLEGVPSGEAARPPTPDVYGQILELLKGKADGLLMDGAELQLLAGDYPLSSVVLPSGGGAGGVSDHRQLSGRDAGDQHPMGAITGLLKEISRIPEPAEALTNEELEELLK